MNAKGMGRSNPLYEFLEPFTTEVIMDWDDFRGNTLDSSLWTAGNNGGDSNAAAHVSANTYRGLVLLDTGTTDDSISYIIGNEIPYMGQYRAAINAEFYVLDADEAKWEVGFIDAADNAGAVGTKATPTFQASDAAVACYDYDDLDGEDGEESPNSIPNIDLLTVGTTDGVANTSGYTTLTQYGIADNELLNVMVSLDETKSCRMWVNGNLVSRSTTGPNITTALYPWVCLVLRSAPGADNYLYLDYIRAWQERVAIA